MAEPHVRLPTASGAIELYEAKDAGKCISCGRNGGGMARIAVDNHDKQIRICGNCIATAVGLHIRAANRQRNA